MNITIKSSELQQYNPNIHELLNRFIQYVDVSKATTRSYISGIRIFLQYLSNNGINTPTRDTVLLFKKHLSENKKTGTIATYLSALRRFFAWTESEGLYPNITSGIKSPRIDAGHKKDCFTAHQLKSIISGINRDNLKGARDYAIFCLISATGLRTVEVMRADISDIRNIGGEDCLFIQGKGRTSKCDFVKLSAHVLQAINAYLKMRKNTAENSPLFASISHRNAGGRMTTRSISRICKSAMINAGYISKRWTAHSLRHSAITLALIAGISIQEVSQFARHSNIAVTMIYAHDVERLKSKCESTISNMLFGE